MKRGQGLVWPVAVVDYSSVVTSGLTPAGIHAHGPAPTAVPCAASSIGCSESPMFGVACLLLQRRVLFDPEGVCVSEWRC